MNENVDADSTNVYISLDFSSGLHRKPVFVQNNKLLSKNTSLDMILDKSELIMLGSGIISLMEAA